MDNRLGQISQGAKDATAYGFFEKIKESIRILIKGKVDYEFRTTCVPGIINADAIHKIGQAIKGARVWVLQTFVPDNAFRAEYRKKLSPDYIAQFEKFRDIARLVK